MGTGNRLCKARDVTENQVNIPGPIERSSGRPLCMSDSGDVVGNREGDFPSLLRMRRALASLNCADTQAISIQRKQRFSLHSRSPFTTLEKPLEGEAMRVRLTVPNPHQVSKMSSLWRIEQSSVREFGKPDS